MVRNLINKSNLRRVLILFDYFYKMGVIDAMSKTDQWQARDFVTRMRELIEITLWGGNNGLLL